MANRKIMKIRVLNSSSDCLTRQSFALRWLYEIFTSTWLGQKFLPYSLSIAQLTLWHGKVGQLKIFWSCIKLVIAHPTYLKRNFRGFVFHDPMPHSSYVFSCHISSFRNCSTVYFYKSQSNDPLVSDDGIESCLSSFHKHVWNVLCIPYAVLGTLGNAKLSRECGSASRSLPQEKAWQFPSMM